MLLAADWAAGRHRALPDAQQCFEFALDPDVDILTSFRAQEMQSFHNGPPRGAD
jgi:hypothetical protein